MRATPRSRIQEPPTRLARAEPWDVQSPRGEAPTMRTTDRRTFASAVVVLPGLVGLTLGLGVPARAETTLCTAITSLPTAITVQGIYCLTSNFDVGLASGAAITIDTNNVVIDLNGHKIGNLGAGPGTLANGIFAYQRQNITIKNGTIRGFLAGIFLDDSSSFTASQGHLVEDVRTDQNTYVGILVQGRGSIVRRNQVVSTGGTTVNGANTDGFGIWVFGAGHRVIDNDVVTVTKVGTGTAYGIALDSSSNSAVVNNRVGAAE